MGGVVYTSDPRVAVSHTGSGGDGGNGDLWTMTIRSTKVTDTSRYECQVNTEPKKSKEFSLRVVGRSTTRHAFGGIAGGKRIKDRLALGLACLLCLCFTKNLSTAYKPYFSAVHVLLSIADCRTVTVSRVDKRGARVEMSSTSVSLS